MEGANRMNDIYAVEVFSVENLVHLIQSFSEEDQSEVKMREIEYLTPFVLWYAAVAIGELRRELRLELLEIVFIIFRKWLIVGRGVFPSRRGPKLVVEILNLKRYLNSVIFLYHVIRDYDNVELNRIGTHPVENFFGLIRVSCHENHSWDRFLSAAAKGVLSGEILVAQGLKAHIRRDYSIAGMSKLWINILKLVSFD
jgi:hypothetical protein